MNLITKIINWLKTHKLIVSLIFFILILAVIYLPAKARLLILGPEAKYQTVLPKIADLTEVVDVSGEIKAKEQVNLKFQASGKLAWIAVKEGDSVKKGQAIASLDKIELKKNLEKEVYDYLSERWDFEQSQQDYGTRGLPLEKSALTDAARRILQKAQFDLNQSVLNVEISQETYNLATIYTPIAGIVTQVDMPLTGVNITPATATFTIIDPQMMIFEAKVDEADIGKIKEGQPALVSLDSYPDQQFETQVNRIDFVSANTKSGGTAFPVEMIMPANDNLRFKVGMNGDAQIIIQKKDQAISLPSEAIKEKDGQSYIQVIENRQIKDINITTGISTDSRIEIITPVNKDQRVIIGEKKKEK